MVDIWQPLIAVAFFFGFAVAGAAARLREEVAAAAAATVGLVLLGVATRRSRRTKPTRKEAPLARSESQALLELLLLLQQVVAIRNRERRNARAASEQLRDVSSPSRLLCFSARIVPRPTIERSFSWSNSGLFLAAPTKSTQRNELRVSLLAPSRVGKKGINTHHQTPYRCAKKLSA